MPADGRAARGFTLAELLAVLAIVLIVLVGSIGVWLALAGAVAPGQSAAVVQAMLVGAREYAVSNGVATRVVFENDLDNVENGTTMYFEAWDKVASSWKRILGRGPMNAGRQVFVLKDAPLNLPSAPQVAADDKNPDASTVNLWQTYRDNVSKALAVHAFTNVNAKGYLGDNAAFTTGQTGQAKFCVTFDPTGTLATDADSANPNVLTILQVPGAGRRVGEYEFYVLNVNTGTRLVFD